MKREDRENDPLAKMLREIIKCEMVSEFLGRDATEEETNRLLSMASKAIYN